MRKLSNVFWEFPASSSLMIIPLETELCFHEFTFNKSLAIGHVKVHVTQFYHIDTDEIAGFFLLVKNRIFARTVKILFLSLTCEDIDVAMVTSMISQLQKSFPLSRAAGSFQISFTKWLVFKISSY